MQWWGYNKEHGWVVLDRNIPGNRSGIKGDLMFFRCKDTKTFFTKRETWRPPLYRFAPNYLSELAPEASAEATAELDALKLLWPEYEAQIKGEIRTAEEAAKAALPIEEEVKKPRKAAAAKAAAKIAAAKEVEPKAAAAPI